MRFRTWHAEAAVVAATLAVVVIATGNAWREWIGAAGVLGSFLHATVGDRLAEREAARHVPTVDCHRWSVRYFALREAAWFLYFATGRAWSALVGCVLFLVYPVWRKWWRRRNPLPPEKEVPSASVE